jgi:hypothetical protein
MARDVESIETCRAARPRVWLAGRPCVRPTPLPTVRNTRQQLWVPGDDGDMHMADGWHRASWEELHRLFDLVEA